MKTIFEYLVKYKKHRRSFARSEEYNFFMTNRAILMKIPRFSFLNRPKQDEYNIMRANILIHAYWNKIAIEEEMDNFQFYMKKGEYVDHAKILQTLKEKMLDRPYLKYKNDKIYIPLFSRTLNALYNHEPEKLLNEPYKSLKEKFDDSIIDCFDIYGYHLLNSTFTRLILVKETDKGSAFFHYDTNTIYFVNPQGRLDNKLVLFDKYMKRPNYNHMLERIIPVAEAYFEYNKTALLNALHDKGLISAKMLYLLHRKKGMK